MGSGGSGGRRCGATVPGRVDRFVARHFWLIIATLTTVLAAVYTVDAVLLVRGLDLRVYRAGGYAWLHGIGLYSDQFPGLLGVSQPLQFTYPPLSAILFTPMAVLPFGLALVLHELVNIGAVLLTCLLVTTKRFAKRRTAFVAALAVTAVASALEPVRETLYFGQINLVLMLMICADALLPKEKLHGLPRGVLTGIAAAVKLTPAVFVLFFLVRKDWRAAGSTVLTFVGTAGLAFALAPGDSRTYWLHALLDPSRIGDIPFAHNQSFNAMIYRIGLTGGPRSVVWVTGALLIVVLGVVAARRATRAGDDLAALFVIAAVGLIASPVSWDHHWVWIVPAVFALVSAVRTAPGWRRWASVLILATFVLPVHAVLPSMNLAEMRWTWWQHLLGNTYLYVAAGLVVYLAVRRTPARAGLLPEPVPAPVRTADVAAASR